MQCQQLPREEIPPGSSRDRHATGSSALICSLFPNVLEVEGSSAATWGCAAQFCYGEAEAKLRQRSQGCREDGETRAMKSFQCLSVASETGELGCF